MRFEHAPDVSYEDVGGGRVLHSAPGFPGFPARLALEVFERARLLTGRERVGLWDPLCGAGGLVTTLAVLRAGRLTRVLASDLDVEARELAGRNLALTTSDGLSARRAQLVARGSDPERLHSVDRWEALLPTPPVPWTVANADATDPASLAALDLAGIDLVVTDLPYGAQTEWASDAADAASLLHTALSAVLPTGAVIAVVTTEKAQLAALPPATRSFKHGHRHIRMYRVV